MLTENKISFRILGVLKLAWEMGEAYAKERPYHALSLRLSGDAHFMHGEDEYSVKKGGMIYVPSNYDYTINALADESVIVVHFEVLGDAPTEIEVFTPQNPEIYIDLFSKMYRIWQSKTIGYEYRAESLFARVLEGMMSESFYLKNSIRRDFSTLLDFLHLNFTDPSVTVASLAKRMSVSETYLRRLFNDALGTSPIKYLTRLRLEYATSLLDTGFYTIEDVARKVGYSDAKYFSTLYKRTYGISPSKR